MIPHQVPRGPRLIVLDEKESTYYSREGGTPEQPLIEWSRQLASPDKTFVDVGAHCGTWSLSLAPLFRDVVAFEAQRSTFHQLCGGIALSDLSHKVEAHHVAIGDSNDRFVELQIVSRDGGGSSIEPTSRVTLRTEKTRMRTLDSFELQNVGLVKIDVEGAEVRVLEGARETLEKSDWPRIIVESWDPNQDRQALETRAALLRVLSEKMPYRVLPIRSYPEMFLAERVP